MPGFPIRTPWDHSLVDSSPRPIAASHVLHRLLVPRHPPFALDNLTTKMLASTVQFSTNNQPTTHSPTPATTTWSRFARPGHAWRLHPREHRPPGASQGSETTTTRVVPSGPNRVLTSFTSRTTVSFPPPRRAAVLEEPRPLPAPNLPVSPPSEHPDPTFAGRGLHATFRWMVLLRKEVIQPHLPVRLPCYDFVPIASPTFDGSLHKGWATGFGCCRLS